MVLAVAKMNGNSRLAARHYATEHPTRRHPTQSTFAKVFNQFRRTGSVVHQRRTKDVVISEAFEANVLAFVAAYPEASIRQVARECGSTRSSVWKVLSKHRLHPYHVCLHQDLTEEDYRKRLDFCNWALIQKEADNDFFSKIIWTDEAKFCRDGNVNLHNAHYWADQNPHWLREHKHQTQWSVNVWCGLFGDKVIGPYFFDGNLTGRRYVQILRDIVDDFACSLPLHDLQRTWFQHDGAPPHFSAPAREWLDRNFPHQWIGREGPMYWPPRSPDLTPLDFFLWGYVKSKVYVTEPLNVSDLKHRISSACAEIPREAVRRAVGSLEKRCMTCIAAEGKHFEHFL